MVSIDEAIEKYKEITNTKAICPGHCNISCDKCLQESKQIAEWLEQLKAYKQNTNICPMCDTYCSYLTDEYNKAIDDFYNDLADDLTWLMGFGEEVYLSVGDNIRMRAEQLKAGGVNGKKKYIELS